MTPKGVILGQKTSKIGKKRVKNEKFEKRRFHIGLARWKRGQKWHFLAKNGQKRPKMTKK